RRCRGSRQRARVRFPSVFEIGGRQIGGGAPTYVIAEIGSNHDRDRQKAEALIDAAVEAGADAVKFQTYSGASLYSRKTPPFQYLEAVASGRSPAELLEEIA